MKINGWLQLAITLLTILPTITACAVADLEPSITPMNTAAIPGQETAVSPTMEPTATPTLESLQTLEPTATQPAVDEQSYCSIGLGLRRETVEILLNNRSNPGLVQAANLNLAEEYFPVLEGWIRVIGGPSLDILNTRAARADEISLPYEGLSYGLETSESTPAEEWQNLVESTKNAKAISSEYDKLLAMGPGFRLMTDNPDSYPGMAAEADIWIIQTQRLQAAGPGDTYRTDVEEVVSLIRQSNPEIQVWAQITFLPDRPADAQEWLAYRDSIADLVDGTFIGVYIWDHQNTLAIQNEIIEIFDTVCQVKDETP